MQVVFGSSSDDHSMAHRVHTGLTGPIWQRMHVGLLLFSTFTDIMNMPEKPIAQHAEGKLNSILAASKADGMKCRSDQLNPLPRCVRLSGTQEVFCFFGGQHLRCSQHE